MNAKLSELKREVSSLLSDLEHDKRLAVSFFNQTKKIISSKKGLIFVKKQLSALNKQCAKARKALHHQYPKMFKRVQNGIAALRKARIPVSSFEKRLKSLKKYY